MTQKAVKDNYLPLTGGKLTGALEVNQIESKSSREMVLKLNETPAKGAELKFFYDVDDGGTVTIRVAKPYEDGYHELILDGTGGFAYDNQSIAVGRFLPMDGGKMSGDIAKDTNTSALTLSGSMDGGHGARLDLVGEDYTVDTAVQGCFGLHSIKAGKDNALIGYPDGRLTWDGRPAALGAIRRLASDEVVSYADASSQNSNDTWVRAVYADVPAGSTWFAYNSAGEEWSYIFSKSPTGAYGNIFRMIHQGRLQVKGVSSGSNFSKWKEVTMTALDY